MRSVGFLLLCLVGLAGCGDDEGPAAPPVEPQPVTRSWAGSFENTTDGGPIVLELVEVGEAVQGEVVLWSPAIEDAIQSARHLYVRGTIRNDVMQLELDLDRVPYTFTFTIDATFAPGSSIDGTLALEGVVPSAGFICRPLERRTITGRAMYLVPENVHGLAFDGGNLWLSTVGSDYLVATLEAVVVRGVVVLYEGIYHWTSDALTWDGALIWGHLPVTVQGPGWSRNESKLIGFDAQGNIVRTFPVTHRTAGLAWDGASFLSLESGKPRVHRFDAAGANLESFAIEVPDPVYLAADAERLWTVGWALKRLYELDPSTGSAVAVYELPGDGFGFHAGLAREGAALWYAYSNPFEDSTPLYRLPLE